MLENKKLEILEHLKLYHEDSLFVEATKDFDDFISNINTEDAQLALLVGNYQGVLEAMPPRSIAYDDIATFEKFADHSGDFAITLTADNTVLTIDLDSQTMFDIVKKIKELV